MSFWAPAFGCSLPLHRYSVWVVHGGPEFAPNFCVQLDPRIVFAGQSVRRRLTPAIVRVCPKIIVAPFVSGRTRLLYSPDAWTIRLNPFASAILRVCIKLGQVSRLTYIMCYSADDSSSLLVLFRVVVVGFPLVIRPVPILTFLLSSNNVPDREVSPCSRRIRAVCVIDLLW